MIATLGGYLDSGGPIVLLLLGMSALSLALIAARIVALLPVLSGEDRRADAMRAWALGDREMARAKLAEGHAPADRIAYFALEAQDRGVALAAIQAEMERRGNAEVEALSRHLRLLEVIAMVAPLLGLLGTVLGMIESFQQLELEAGSANASVLAGGIWQALLTTAAGLLVAIPAAIAAALLAARVDRAAASIERTAGQAAQLAQ